jgi:hypothetical protein
VEKGHREGLTLDRGGVKTSPENPTRKVKTMSKKELAEQQTHLPALASQYEEDANQGFENADVDSFAIPFLQVLQSMSPQCKKSDGAYIKGAEEGMIFNTVTQELVDGDKGVLVIPCHYRRTFINWKPRSQGGGFLGEYGPSDPLVSQITRDAEGATVLPDGTLLNDTRVHYALIMNDEGIPAPAVLSWSSSQIKKSKTWMSKMDAIKMRRADGSVFTPPMFSHVYRLTTVPESNDKGSWFGWKVELVGPVEDANVYQAAKKFRDAIKQGELKENHAAAAAAVEGEEIPF